MRVLSAEQCTGLTEQIRTLLKTAFPPMSHSSCGAVAVDTINALLDDIGDVVQKEFALYARARNEKLPVSKLPQPLLHRIADLLSPSALDESILVCQHWRASLEPFPHLWRDVRATIGWVALRTPGELRRMLRRAGDNPNSISLRCWSSEGESSPLQDLLTPQLAHLTSLTIEVPRLDGTFWSDILCAPAPCLERLLVCTSADQAQRLPDNLLSGNAPKLTELVLSNVFIPAVPCAVLGNVTSLRLLKVKFMSLADMNLVFTQFAKLEHLLMDVISGDGGETTSLRTVPRLRSLRIRDFVWPGPLDLLVRALQPDGQFFLAWPRPVHIEEVIAQLQRSKSGWNTLSVRWSTQVIGIINMPAALALVASSDTGGARGALFVESERVALQLRAASSRVTMVKQLSIADDTWSRIVDIGTFTRLEILTLDLAPQSGQANYAHLFILQQPPMVDLCPALREVRLVRDPVRASKIDFVRVGAVYLSQWLPSTVKKLLLRGVKAVEPGIAALYGQVEELCLESSEVDFERVAEETRKWSWNFSFEDAVHAG